MKPERVYLTVTQTADHNLKNGGLDSQTIIKKMDIMLQFILQTLMACPCVLLSLRSLLK